MVNIVLKAVEKSKYDNQIEIYDLFCGSGHDVAGNSGSPIKIINALNTRKSFSKDLKINIYFNDINKDKIQN